MKQEQLDIARLFALAEILPRTDFRDWAGTVLMAAERLRDSAWRPIETAPKDGTSVLLWMEPSGENYYGELVEPCAVMGQYVVWPQRMKERDGMRDGWYLERARTKTGAAAKPPLSTALADDLYAYAKRDGRTPIPTAVLFGSAKGKGWDRFQMADLFAELRRITFGKKERRQFQDMRRSANLEADLGGASAQDRAAVMANALDKNKSLDAVYTPVTVARARKAQEAREAGRALLEQELGRDRSRKHPPGGV